MCSGRPVVGSRIGGITEQLGDGKRGLLVDPGDFIGFSEAICKLLDDPNLVDQFVMSGKEYASKFTIARHVNALIEVYRKILNPLSGNCLKYVNQKLPE
jgi:glycosyltransferase involved in cell wall biosynthesis